MSARSWLFVPGDQPRKLEKAAGGPAEAVIVDLEDGVAPERKELAIGLLTEFFGRVGEPLDRYWIRIDPGSDLATFDPLVLPGLGGIVVAKAESASLERVDDWLTWREATRGSAGDTVPTMALVESAAGVDELLRMVRAPRRVRFLSLGEVDLCADLGLLPGPDELELQTVRTLLVVKAAAWGLEPPVGPASTEFTDLEAFASSTRRLLRLGFGSRAAIHPAQLQVIEDVFTPGCEELQRARAVVAASEAASGRGEAVIHVPSLGMIDEAVVRRARRWLSRSRENCSG